MVSGKGVVKIMLKGINYVLNDVYFIPELKNNFLSVRQLQKRDWMCCIKEENERHATYFIPQKEK